MAAVRFALRVSTMKVAWKEVLRWRAYTVTGVGEELG